MHRTAPLPAAARAAAFLLGGIGTGNVSIGSRGEFRDWELANAPGKGVTLPFSFFAIDVRGEGIDSVTRVLESRLVPPYADDRGQPHGAVAGLPRFRETAMRGEYPFLDVDFIDESVPASVSLRAFTPFVPLDSERSGIPCAIMRYRVSNPTETAIRVTIAGSLSNPIGHLADTTSDFDRFVGVRDNVFVDDQHDRGVHFTTESAPDAFDYGTMSLTTTDTAVSSKPRWLAGVWNDGVESFWSDLRSRGVVEPEEALTHDTGSTAWFDNPGEDLRVGTLAITHELAPGEQKEFEFLLTWSFPNRHRGWGANVFHDEPHWDEVVRNHYAERFPDSWTTARHLAENLPELERLTQRFHDRMFGSTLPPEIVETATATLTAIRSTTCFRIEGGQFLAYEGSFNRSGSCEGNCTHVWNYAQSVGHLFPDLERTMRRMEFLVETRENGKMEFRANRIFGPQADSYPAVDGQAGTVIRLYRDWKICGDDDFLRELWPSVVRVLDFCLTEWDKDGDYVLDAFQHNTYDIEFDGISSLGNVILYTAMRAGAEMARHLGEDADAERFLDVATTGAERMDAMLWTGEYYRQLVDDIDRERYQYGDGVLSDQVFGQQLAHVVGLGYVLPEEHVRSAIKSVYTHNFQRGFMAHNSTQRTYALNDESGLLLASWPYGGRPRMPFVYSDEVWTGVEHQVASHLIYEGFVAEALEIVRAVRARHDGFNRNPWNEIECGNHYARSLSSWGLVLAYTGVDWNAQHRRLRIDPAVSGPLRSFFSTGTGWGSFELDEHGVTIEVDDGHVEFDELVLPGGRVDTRGTVLTAGDPARRFAVVS